MYLSATVLAMILVSCHAFVPGDLESLAANEAKPYALTIDLTKFLETMKESLRKGDTKLGIPVLDPLKQEHLDLNLKNKIFEIEGALDKLRVQHLSDYTVNKGEFSLIGVRLNVNLTWNEIDLMTLYKVTHGKLIDALSFYGDGFIGAVVKNLQVSVDAGLTANNDGYLYVKEISLGLSLEGLDFNISGLYDDVEVSRIISRIISELIPDLVKDYQQLLSKFGGQLIADQLNKILGKLTLEELLKLLRGEK